MFSQAHEVLQATPGSPTLRHRKGDTFRHQEFFASNGVEAKDSANPRAAQRPRRPFLCLSCPSWVLPQCLGHACTPLSSGRVYPPDSQDPQHLAPPDTRQPPAAGPGEATRASQLGLQAGTWSGPLEVS